MFTNNLIDAKAKTLLSKKSLGPSPINPLDFDIRYSKIFEKYKKVY